MTKLTDLVQATPASGDVIYMVDDPSGTPASRKATIGGILSVGPNVGDPVRGGTASRILYEDSSNNLAESGNLEYLATAGRELELTGATRTNDLFVINAAAGGTQTGAMLAMYDRNGNLMTWFDGVGGAEFNRDQNNADIRIRSQNDTGAIFVDGSTDRVGIKTGNNAVQGTLHIMGKAADKAFIVQAATSQTANLMEIQDSSSVVQFGAGSDGEVLIVADKTTDVAPTDDTTLKKMTLQRLGSDPSNAAFIKFSQSPGTPTNDFYLVLEEG